MEIDVKREGACLKTPQKHLKDAYLSILQE